VPYYSEDTDARSVLPISEIPTSFGDVMEAQFASSVTELPSVATARLIDLESARGRGKVLDPEEQSRRLREAGLERDLTPEDGLTDSALDILIERKQDEIRRTSTIARGRGGFAEGASRLGVAIATSFADPVSAAANFIPIVGEARYLKMLGQASMAGRLAVRAGVGAAEGAAGAALIEPFIYASKVREQADYDLADSLLNVAFGTLTGSGIHVLGGTTAEAIRRGLGRAQPWDAPTTNLGRTLETGATARQDLSAEGLARAADEGARPADGVAARLATESDPEVRESALQAAVGQMVDGRPVDVEAFFAGERALLPDGRDTADLVPERFSTERAPVGELLARTREAIAGLEARVRALGERPRIDAKTVARYQRLKERTAALEAVERGDASPEQVETVRQAAVADAVERGVPVPGAALRGAAPDTRNAAVALRDERIAAEAVRPRPEPEPERVEEPVAEGDTPDARLAEAEEAAATAEALAAADLQRVGLPGEFEPSTQMAKDADRWSRAADVAQACLLRAS
jgi:hypothetical protein